MQGRSLGIKHTHTLAANFPYFPRHFPLTLLLPHTPTHTHTRRAHFLRATLQNSKYKNKRHQFLSFHFSQNILKEVNLKKFAPLSEEQF